MFIFFGQDIAEKLSESYTILPLEKIRKGDEYVRAYCVVPSDKINFFDIPNLNNHKQLHLDFLNAWENKNYDVCRNLGTQLLGKFSGELDTFYNELLGKLPN